MSTEENKEKKYWVLFHLNKLEYFRKQFENKLSKNPPKTEIPNLEERALQDTMRNIKNSIRWYRNGIEYHKEKALNHVNKKPDWIEKIDKLDSEIDKRLALLPRGQEILKLDIMEKCQLAIQLYDLANWLKDEIETIRYKAFEDFNDSEKVKWAKEKSDLENKSLENLFITADKLKPDYNVDFVKGNEYTKTKNKNPE